MRSVSAGVACGQRGRRSGSEGRPLIKPVLQCPRMLEPDASKAVLTLLNVLVDGSGPEGSMVLNRNDPGLLKSLSLVSAEQASVIAPSGGSSIAAHVDPLRYLLELLNRWSRGERDVFENAAFGTSWTRSTVSAEEWDARCEALAREAQAWAEPSTARRRAMVPELT